MAHFGQRDWNKEEVRIPDHPFVVRDHFIEEYARELPNLRKALESVSIEDVLENYAFCARSIEELGENNPTHEAEPRGRRKQVIEEMQEYQRQVREYFNSLR